MKTTKTNFRPRLLTAMTLVFSLLFFACGDDDDQGQNTTADTIAAVEATMSSGTWVVTLYNDSGVDETSDYDGYTFSFNPDGTLVATNNTTSYNGTWSVTADSDSSSDDNSSYGDIDFNIFFNSPELLMEFNDDWDIDSRSDTRLALSDVSGGDGTTDLLTFEKN